MTRTLAELRVLVVEDDWAIRAMIEDMLTDLGCVVAGSEARLEGAAAAARTASFDLAVMDVDLDGRSSLLLADSLLERGVPVVFATGYGAEGLPMALRSPAVLQKPFAIGDLERALLSALGAQHR